MANQEELDLLKQGRAVWNTWRKQHPSLRPDLSGADLSGADLSNIELDKDTRITPEQIGQAKPGTHA
jgi:uncharacterized protein YjbI with pentapeptide repeats